MKMRAGISTYHPPGASQDMPLLWLSIGDKSMGYFAGEAEVHPADTLMARRHEMARVLRHLATQFEGNE
jgi:hypothetical protein